MPIHFSIGFVVERRPRRPYEGVCAVAGDVDVFKAAACTQQSVGAVANNIQRVNVTWPRDLGDCE